MGHSRPLMIFGKHKDLCLAGESAEGRIVQDAVAVTFEARAMRVWCFLDRPISGPIGPRCMLGKDRVFPFLTDLASENRCCADFGSGVGMGQNDLSIGRPSLRPSDQRACRQRQRMASRPYGEGTRYEPGPVDNAALALTRCPSSSTNAN
jgi:hypothetical protein